MGPCEVCGNHDGKAFEILQDGERHVFDSFECAIEKLAPRCNHCGCRIIGHGVMGGAGMYCCAHCARTASSSGAGEQAPRRGILGTA